jgi:hypothetical protein
MQCGELSLPRRMPGGDGQFASIIAPAPPNRSAQFACKPVWRGSRAANRIEPSMFGVDK